MALYFGSNKSGKVNVIKKERFDEGYELGYDEGYETGKQDFGAVATESGVEVVLENVNETDHTVAVNLTSETITDFSGVNLTVRGGNLFNAQYEDKTNVAGTYEYGNNFIINKGVRPSGETRLIYTKQYPAGTYTLSCKTTYSLSGNYSFRLLCTKAYSGGTYNATYKSYWKEIANLNNPNASFTFTVNEPFEIGFSYNANNPYGRMETTDIMLTLTEKSVEYEPYFEPITYQLNANGKMQMENIASTMILSTDSDDVIINAEYYLDSAKEIEKYKNIILDLGGEI